MRPRPGRGDVRRCSEGAAVPPLNVPLFPQDNFAEAQVWNDLQGSPEVAKLHPSCLQRFPHILTAVPVRVIRRQISKMIMCELELFYICVVGALLCGSHCQDFCMAKARVGGWGWEFCGALGQPRAWGPEDIASNGGSHG